MIAFVVLHYNDIEVTKDCVNKLLLLESNNEIRIVVVDNGSPNGSGDILKKKYQSVKNVEVTLTGVNLGFAKGNNYGYIIAKQMYNPDYIVVMNNDVMIDDKKFVYKLLNNSVLNNYEVIMPDIINKMGVHQNPFRENPLSNAELLRNISSIIAWLTLYHIPVLNKIWSDRNKETERVLPTDKIYNTLEMMVPHGACIIFSKKWIYNEDVAFVPDTFLYGEEDILYEYVANKGYKTYFEKTLVVEHIEDVSTDSVVKTNLKKAQFLLKNSYASQKILLRLRKYNLKNMSYSIVDRGKI